MDRDRDDVQPSEGALVAFLTGEPGERAPTEEGFTESREEQQEDRQQGPGETELGKNLRPWHGDSLEEQLGSIGHVMIP
ncbi:hypothetical protein B005_3163 [Nocardiopsis alba ATCC BAA-2165]|uniref:Uncharacterized protein n=1 Tax=Nocardiopsis alba (strain ATCC BAA-2165 / BE74) TaxID=1205910 RepID=J7L5Q9_NOCAA|nr:hypothetical protein B005_3163 [Nocardiopsis alba ATCC BAA-2165]